MYSKNLDFPDAPITEPGDEWQPAFQYYFNGPRIHEFLQEQYKETFSKYECVSDPAALPAYPDPSSFLKSCVTIGELPFTPDLITVLEYVSAARRELDICIQFDLSTLDHHNGRFRHSIVEWKLPELKDVSMRLVLNRPESLDLTIYSTCRLRHEHSNLRSQRAILGQSHLSKIMTRLALSVAMRPTHLSIALLQENYLRCTCSPSPAH